MWTPDLSDREGPLYRELADAIAVAIEEGALPPGERLPTQRDLAQALGVALTTVTRGYAEAERRGLVRGEVGRGTFVRTRSPRTTGYTGEEDVGEVDLRPNALVPWPFGPELLDGAARHLTQADPGDLFAYHPNRGQRAHRAAGAAVMERVGLATDPDQVLVTTGVQHGIMAVFATLCGPGDAIAVEQVSYSGIRSAARVLGIRLVPVPVDREGMRPDALRAALGEPALQALYCTPTLHNPTSAVMSPARRQEIARVAGEAGLPIIEDDSYGFVLPDVVPIAARYPDTWYLTGTSKPLIPSLRVGFARAPDTAAANRLEAVIAATVCHTSGPAADLAAAWIANGTFERVAAWKREQFATRQAAVSAVFQDADYQAHPRSPHGWLRLPEPWTTREFVHQAAMRRIHLAPADDFAITRDAPHAVRLCVGPTPSRAMLVRAAETLAEMLRQGPDAGRMVV